MADRPPKNRHYSPDNTKNVVNPVVGTETSSTKIWTAADLVVSSHVSDGADPVRAFSKTTIDYEEHYDDGMSDVAGTVMISCIHKGKILILRFNAGDRSVVHEGVDEAHVTITIGMSLGSRNVV